MERVPVKAQDFLDNDPPIRGQNYVCMSFISPEDVILQKEVYFFNKYINFFSKDLGDLFDQMIPRFAHDRDIQDMFINLKTRYEYLFDAERLSDEFSMYKSLNSDQLEQEYLEKNNFLTTMRGIKVRGVYETLIEAQKRAQLIKNFDPKFDVYVAEVGCWCPWSPNPNDIKDQEFAETELNTLVKKYNENLERKEVYHRTRKEEMMKKANEQRERSHVEVLELPDTNTNLIEPIGSQTDAETHIMEKRDPWMERQSENRDT